MTNEELQKLNKLKYDIDHLTRALDRFLDTRPGCEEVTPRMANTDFRLETKSVPGLSDNIRNLVIECITERLDELEGQMNSIVLCTQAVGGPVYTPTELK